VSLVNAMPCFRSASKKRRTADSLWTHTCFRHTLDSIRQHTSAYVSIRQHTSAYASDSLSKHTSFRYLEQPHPRRESHFRLAEPGEYKQVKHTRWSRVAAQRQLPAVGATVEPSSAVGRHSANGTLEWLPNQDPQTLHTAHHLLLNS
jgi:hypothetical protein